MNNYEKNLEKINKYFSEILLLSDVLSFNFDIVSSKSNDFYLPIPIIVYKDMIKCNIVSRRNSQLTKREKNNNELLLENLLDRFKIKYLSEYPIVISNREKWESLCTANDITDDDEFFYRKVIYVDFILSGGLILEADSKKFHQKTSLQIKKDSIRDSYLYDEFNLSTIRLFPLIEFPEKIQNNQDLLNIKFKKILNLSKDKENQNKSNFYIIQNLLSEFSGYDSIKFKEFLDKFFNSDIETIKLLIKDLEKRMWNSQYDYLLYNFSISYVINEFKLTSFL